MYKADPEQYEKIIPKTPEKPKKIEHLAHKFVDLKEIQDTYIDSDSDISDFE